MSLIKSLRYVERHTSCVLDVTINYQKLTTEYEMSCIFLSSYATRTNKYILTVKVKSHSIITACEIGQFHICG